MTQTEANANAIISRWQQYMTEYRQCTINRFAERKFNSIKNHFDFSSEVTAKELNDNTYISDTDAILLKELIQKGPICSNRYFDQMTNVLPQASIVLVHAIKRNNENLRKLINYNITWGQFAENVLEDGQTYMNELKPYLRELETRYDKDREAELNSRYRAKALREIQDLQQTQQQMLLDQSQPQNFQCQQNGNVGITCQKW